MSVVPADAVVLVPRLPEQFEDLARPASLADPVAFDDHQVADSGSRPIVCLRNRDPPPRPARSLPPPTYQH